ncbi:MAG: hypothetical protein ACKOEX_10380 [Planctomycetia bacterium]
MIRTATQPTDPVRLIRPRRVIRGMSAILLPFTADRRVDWDAFAAHVARTASCGIAPAINMDTGYVQLIDDETRRTALRIARETLGSGEFVAGACVVDAEGAGFDEPAYGRQIDMITDGGGVPVIFPSWGLTTGADTDFLTRYRATIGSMNSTMPCRPSETSPSVHPFPPTSIRWPRRCFCAGSSPATSPTPKVPGGRPATVRSWPRSSTASTLRCIDSAGMNRGCDC